MGRVNVIKRVISYSDECWIVYMVITSIFRSIQWTIIYIKLIRLYKTQCSDSDKSNAFSYIKTKEAFVNQCLKFKDY